MTVYCWFDYGYYDGLLTFSQVALRPDPDSPLVFFHVQWLNSAATYDPEQQP